MYDPLNQLLWNAFAGTIIGRLPDAILSKTGRRIRVMPEITGGTDQIIPVSGIYQDMLNPKNIMYLEKDLPFPNGLAPDAILQRPTGWRLLEAATAEQLEHLKPTPMERISALLLLLIPVLTLTYLIILATT